MRANKRMNLFRELNAQAGQKFAMPKIKLGLHAYASLVCLVLFTYVEVTSSRSQMAHVSEVSAKKAEMDQKVADLLKQAEQVAEQEVQFKLAMAKEAKDAKEYEEKIRNRALSGVSSAMDGTWTSVIWKLVTFADQIVVQKIEMGNKDDSSAAGEKKVLIDGSAKSLPILTSWVENLSANLPNSMFIVEKHSLGPEKGFPVAFRLVARIL